MKMKILNWVKNKSNQIKPIGVIELCHNFFYILKLLNFNVSIIELYIIIKY